MAHWVRFERGGSIGFGTLADGSIQVHSGNMFSGAAPTGETVALSDVSLLTPCEPSKFIGLWNNFRALAEKQGNAIPEEPLYFIKAQSSMLAPGGAIRKPAQYDGKIIYEGELGIVIGRRASNVDVASADEYIFGYTCVNDVTALDILTRDPSFPQWTRAKSFDSFGPFGPAIATGLDPSTLVVKTLLNGKERQNYPISDAIFSPREIVSMISREVTLEPGDLITIGTSLGVLPLRSGATVEIVIDGIGTLTNTVE